MIPKEGDRVQLHPATDAWMQGDRYGEVLKVRPADGTNSPYVRVRLDSGRKKFFHPDSILEVVE